MTKKEAKERIEKLKKEISYHRYLYHVKDVQEISDAALDSLKKELFDLELEFPDLITPDSPTQRVGGEPVSEFQKFTHTYPVLSLFDAFSFDDLKDWEKRNDRFLGKNVDFDYYAELKLDGLAIVLYYEKGTLKRGVTRGNGFVGEDVTSNIKTIEDIPLRLHSEDGDVPDELIVRGEVYMKTEVFEKVNKEREKNGEALYANPRNVASGAVRQLDPKITASRELNFFAFDIFNDIGQTRHEEVHEMLAGFGFAMNKTSEYCNNLEEVFAFCDRWFEKREKLPYGTDGVVVVVNDVKLERKLGSVGKAERYMIAYKFPAEQATTVVDDIIVQVGRTGAITPVAHLKPVLVAGSTVKRATLHNADEIERLELRIGDTVVIEKAGDIIPKVISVLKNLRTGKEKKFVFPKKCPVCKTELERKGGDVLYYCVNPDCFAKKREQVIHFVSKSGLDIEGFGSALVDQLLADHLISDVADIFTLTKDDFLSLDLFKEKRAQNIVDAIGDRMKVSLDRFVVALGIPYVGAQTAQLLASHFISLEKFSRVTEEELDAIDGIGGVASKSVVSFFESEKTKELLRKFEKVGFVVVDYVKPQTSSELSGKTFLFTGTLSALSRDSAKREVIKHGGAVLSGVSKKLDYLVVGEKPGSKLKKAEELGVEVITEADFLKMVE